MKPGTVPYSFYTFTISLFCILYNPPYKKKYVLLVLLKIHFYMKQQVTRF